MNLWNESAGFAVIPRWIPSHDLPQLIHEAERLLVEQGRRPAGVRRVLEKSPILATTARSGGVTALVAPILGARPFVVRSLLFDKSPDANWDVVWHQDTTIAVAERADAPGYGPWSCKEGVPHVRPPAEVLGAMVTVRIHLDACLEENGPLLVAPGTHHRGISHEVADVSALEASAVACTVEAGGVVMMRPLLFHASRKAARPSHRRVLHLEFAASELPPPLRWARE